jgi:hypothetical protein
MTSDDRSEKAETGMVPEVANLGIMRPPFVYLGAIALGDGAWYHVSALPSDFRSGVVSELSRMAALPDRPFPKEGLIGVRLETTQLRWRVRMASSDGQCVLTPVHN